MNKRPNPLAALIDELASVRLALGLLLALAALTAAGTIVPQNLGPAEYLRLYSTQTYSFLYWAGLTDVYHCLAFKLLLVLLALNLAACTAARLPGLIALARPRRARAINPSFLSKLSSSVQIMAAQSSQEALETCEAEIRRLFGRPRRAAAPKGPALIHEAGAFSRFGVVVLHLGLLIIMAGALVSQTFGLRAEIALEEGQATSAFTTPKGELAELGFTLRLDSFSAVFDENGRPREFVSRVTFAEPSGATGQAEIRVNHPLRLAGLSLYQRSWGRSETPFFEIEATNRQTGETRTVLAAQDILTPLPGAAAPRLTVTGHDENWLGRGPAVRVSLSGQGRERETIWVDTHGQAQAGGWRLAFKGPRPRYLSILQVGRDPGAGVVWLGCLTLLIGCVVTFFFAHRRLYALVLEEKDGVSVLLAGASHRNGEAFEARFNELVKRIGRNIA